MNKLFVSILFIWSFAISSVLAQPIEIDCTAKPLNELLLEWREQYNFQCSFNDTKLSKFIITKKAEYKSIDQALSSLLKNLPLAYEKSDNIYIIYPLKPSNTIKEYTLIGKVLEARSLEPLPFSHVITNGIQTVTDIKGMFSFSFENDSVFQIKASHLGCYILDTTLIAGQDHQLILTPSIVGIKEVTVTNNIVEKSTQIGESPGLTSLNHHIANYLPGNGDNSVFNLLRLQPGVLAAGEQPNDLIIWGSPEGTSRVTFDGFTIWGLKNFNDNISAVNPYMAKNIEVLKGGYDATNEDVIGGIVKVGGKTGSKIQPSLNLFINNQTLNGMVELPVLKQSSIMLAFRQTYYNLFDSEDLKYIKQFQGNNVNINAIPDYQFRDFNIKYSHQNNNGNLFFISLIHGNDDFKTQTTAEYARGNWEEEREEQNKQLGGTIFYGKTRTNGNASELKISYSGLESKYSLYRDITLKQNNLKRVNKDDIAHNDVSELSALWKNTHLLNQTHTLTSGIELINNEIILTEDTFDTRYIDLSERTSRISLFLQDKMRLSSKVSLTAGLRYNHSTFNNKISLDPRIGITIRASGNIKLNASWGQYHQFLVKSSIEDENGNFRYSWTLADDDEVPVMKSHHWVIGSAYTRNNLLFSIDAFHKHNDGLTRFVRYNQINFVRNGNSRSYGIDLYAKQDFNGHSVWASYSISKTEEYYTFFPDDNYRRSPQDQRHEIKLATLFNLGSFHLSASYVYGSGFPIYSNYIQQEYVEPNYNRLDASLIYQLRSTKFDGEVGLSVLNVTDADNIKYTQFERVPIEQINTVFINTDAVSFTPLLYLKLKF